MKRRLRTKARLFLYSGLWNLGLPRSFPNLSTRVNKIVDSIAQPRAPITYAPTPTLGTRNKTRLLAGPKPADPQIRTNGRYLQDFSGQQRHSTNLSIKRP